MKKKYYTLDEVKDKFKEYRELKVSDLTEDEYDLFCEELHVLPKEIVDKVHTEIQFVPMSGADPKKGNLACYVSLLKELVDEGRQGIIVLTPFVFASYTHESGEEIKADNMARPHILHEVAHHYLKHYEYKDEKDREEKEKAAREKVYKWVKQFSNHLRVE